MKKILFIILILLLAMTLLWVVFATSPRKNVSSQPGPEQKTKQEMTKQENATTSTVEQPREQTKETDNQVPLDNWQQRITKKPFGIYITPDNSPVRPEKFQGWHTGTDFEIFGDEVELKVEIAAICSGEIIEKKYVGGYGGVLVQSCRFQEQPITVLYGHLNLENNSLDVGKNITRHQTIGVLAADQSFYSDSERKHLHLGISRGQQIQLRGYVQTKNQLTGWLDYQEIEHLLD